MLHLVRKLAATVLGQNPNDPLAMKVLREAGVPVSEAKCRTCADPCDEGHEEFSKRFDVDMETELRGSVKPYRRQVVISTGKADWAREVTSENDSLAKYISSAEDRRSGARKNEGKKEKERDKENKDKDTTSYSSNSPAGVYAYKPSGRLSILNGSHHSISDDPDTHATVLVLPDYVAVSNVVVTAAGAGAFWQHALDPAISRAGTAVTPGGEELKSWTLPYNCLIMFCSHKRRDARCHITAQHLEEDFARTLESEGWHVDTDLEDLFDPGPPLESIADTEEAREVAALEQLRALTGSLAAPASDRLSEHGNGSQNGDAQEDKLAQTDTSNQYLNSSQNQKQNQNPSAKQKKALILKNSHIGGHRFAGNVIIYFPQGSSIWYGRVTPHEVHAIVQHTILEGKVLPQLLRGGLGITRLGCSSLLDW